MKKKGFTLVELLAVIAILAILVIIALPNIMDLFNDTKYNSFKNEVKEIFKTAESQFITDSMNGASDVFYARGTDCPASGELKLSGRTDIKYGIVFNKKGEVTKYKVTDGKYIFSFSFGATRAPLKIENIGNGTYLGRSPNNYFATLNDFNKTISDITCTESGFDLELE